MSFPTWLPTPRPQDPLRRAGPALGHPGPGLDRRTFRYVPEEAYESGDLAVGGRSPEKARAFADRWSIPRASGSTEELVADPASTRSTSRRPHHSHFPGALAAIEAGKHALVEKPLALNAARQGSWPKRRARGVF